MITSNDDIGEAPYSASVDLRVLGFTLALSVLITLAFSVAPALQFLRPRLAETLRQTAGTASKNSQRFRKVAVGFQIFLTVLLLGGAGLFLRTLTNLRNQNIGFQTTHVAGFDVDPALAGYSGDHSIQVDANVVDAVREVPGVQQAGATTDPEISGNSNSSNYSVQGHVAPEDENMNFESPWITSSYFSTLHQPILAGREFTAADTKGSPLVAVVNLTFAKRFYGAPQNALGRLIAEGAGDDVKPDTTIVGVVGDVQTPKACAMRRVEALFIVPICSSRIPGDCVYTLLPDNNRQQWKTQFENAFTGSIQSSSWTACALWRSRSTAVFRTSVLWLCLR